MENWQDELGLEIAVVSSYEWEMDIRIAVASENFRGVTEVEASPDWLNDLAVKFRGYPKTRDDRFRVEIGIEKYRYAVIEASCTDFAGHTMIAVTLTEEPGTAICQEARIVIPFEPAAADEFASALERIADARSGQALLVGSR